MTKIKHHPFLVGVCVMGAFYISGIILGALLSPWWWLLYVPGLSLYLGCLVWNERNALMCPECNRTLWDKTKYYCPYCGCPLVFRAKEKVKKGEKPKPETIVMPACSKGHRLYGSEKYCPKCGEQQN